jgi:penicillin amidase
MQGNRQVKVSQDLAIARDEWGIPHVFATNDEDLFFGFGYAMAQDRLWQLDYLRRKALGRLSEVLGHDAVEQDIVARTVGIPRIAEQEVENLSQGTELLLNAFAKGVNAAIDSARQRLPIEFALLDYRPEPWSVLSSVAIWQGVSVVSYRAPASYRYP